MSIVLSSYISFGPVKILLYKQRNFIFTTLNFTYEKPLFLSRSYFFWLVAKRQLKKIKEDAIIKIMTEGSGLLPSFARNSSDITTVLPVINFSITATKPLML